jgi:hypothetical protein
VGTRRRPSARRARHDVPADAGDSLAAVLARTVRAEHLRDPRAVEAGLDRLATAPAGDADAEIATMTDRVLASLFAAGWQPADVDRVTAPVHRPRVAAMIRRHMTRYPADRVAARWAAQLGALTATEPPPGDRHGTLRAVVEILAVLNHLPDLPLLMPPPGVARTPVALAAGADRRMLGRIRALLAKAESTTFAEEAEAYSAKAQELITRHRIDRALVTGEVEDPDTPMGVRVPVDPPYPEAKARLLHVVAEANGCEAVWSEEDGFGTVFGFADDLGAVEILYASLLVQATAAMVREGSARHDAPARTKTFRQSFMHAYTIRIGQRLATTSRAAATGSDDRLLPVLARRDVAVRTAVATVFPRLETGGRTIRIDSDAGWRSGTASADRAGLDR